MEKGSSFFVESVLTNEAGFHMISFPLIIMVDSMTEYHDPKQDRRNKQTMTEGFDQLTPEEVMLVQCLKGCKIPGKDDNIDSGMTSKEAGVSKVVQTSLQDTIPGETVNNDDHLSRDLMEKKTDDRSLKTIVHEMDQAIRDDLIRIQADAGAVLQTMVLPTEIFTVKTLNVLLENVEKCLLQMAEFRGKIQRGIQMQQQLDAETVVREMIDKGLECRKIQIDDMCFEIDDDKTIRQIKGKGSIA
jgi:hypothetical protein